MSTPTDSRPPLKLVDGTAEYTATPDDHTPNGKEPPGADDAGDERRERISQTTKLLQIAEGFTYFHAPDQEAYVSFDHGKHRETWPVRSTAFRRFLAHRFYTLEGQAIRGQSLGEAVEALAGRALYGEGAVCRQVHVRVAGHNGAVFLDLADECWQQIRITAASWQVIDAAASPVAFRRSAGMLPLPMPVPGGDLNTLRTLLTVGAEEWPLLLAWLLASFLPTGPFPVLILTGEQGAAKSTTGRLARGLVDPSGAPLRAEPRDLHDLAIAAGNGWVLAYDNLSHLSAALSDGICRLATGGGFATRRLYTDAEESIFQAMRPVLITSIEDVATRPDLLDRALLVRLPAILPSRRRTERALMAQFTRTHPALLGALLDVVVIGLRFLPTVQIAALPRLADFYQWIVAWAKGCPDLADFTDLYARNREEAAAVAADESALTLALRRLVDAQPAIETDPF